MKGKYLRQILFYPNQYAFKNGLNHVILANTFYLKCLVLWCLTCQIYNIVYTLYMHILHVQSVTCVTLHLNKNLEYTKSNDFLVLKFSTIFTY